MKKKKSAVNMVSEIKYLKGTKTPWAWFQWDIEYLELSSTSNKVYKMQRLKREVCVRWERAAR